MRISDWSLDVCSSDLFVAQNFAIDGLIYPIIYQTLIDGVFSTRGASALSMVTQFQTDWYGEVTRWVDSVLKIAASESAANATVLGDWISAWSARSAAALLPVVASVDRKSTRLNSSH